MSSTNLHGINKIEMEEQLITFKTAKLAKEMGFNVKTHFYYSKNRYSKNFELHEGFDDDYWGENNYYDWNTLGEPYKPFSKECYSAPTQALLGKWLRDVHNINVESNFLPNIQKYRCLYKPQHIKTKDCKTKEEFKSVMDKYISTTRHETHEEALEEGLLNGLKVLQEETKNINNG
jgi:hypothetical protein